MTTLDTLIKLEQVRLDDQRRMLSQLQDLLARIEQEIADLQVTQAREAAVVRGGDPTVRLTLEPFLAQVKQRLQQLQQAKRDAEDAIAVAHDRLAELFETQKRYEIIRDQRAAEAAAAAKRQEQQELDETAAQTHERRGDGG